MLQHARLSKRFWEEAVRTAVYLKNRSLTKAVDSATPFKLPPFKHGQARNLYYIIYSLLDATYMYSLALTYVQSGSPKSKAVLL